MLHAAAGRHPVSARRWGRRSRRRRRPVGARPRRSRPRSELPRAEPWSTPPYRYGGNTPQGGFDCSGLIVYVYRNAAGVGLPRTVAQLAQVGQPVRAGAMRSGDLVLFDTAGRFSHAGIYVGGGRFVHAPSRGGVVRLDGVYASYWRPRFSGVRRV
ncbi:MAG: C40 family peptidase [Burkholderiaceae bacterium]|nr:C40 family peptidase [Burkholderiaceae bacterium]